jgi:curli biogenesis system outer membrane secretion channel CsgG
MTLKTIALIASIGLAAMAAAQTTPPPKPAAPRPAAARSNPVDDVIGMVKAGLSETLIIKKLAKDNKPVNLTTADLVKLKNAGVSENIMNVMMDPTSATAPAPAAATPATAPAAGPEPVPPPPPPPVVAETAPPSAPGPAGNDQKKRVAVDAFDYSAVMTSVQAIFGTQQNIGKGIQAMLITRMAKDGKVVVVDRAKLQQVMAEQDFNQSNRVKQGAGARVGRISGADAILAGDIIIFGRDDKKKSGAVAAATAYCKFCGALGAGKKDDKAVVAITYRLIDAETTEVIATGEARGESKRSGFNVGAAAGAYWRGAGAGTVDMTSSNFADTIIGEATQDCVNKLAAILNDQSTTMKKTVREVETSVLDVGGGTVTIGAGQNDGVNAGDVFEIHRVIKELKDPTTGEVLDRKTEMVGRLTINTVRPKISIGSYTGTPPAASKDYVAIKRMQ